MNTLLSLFLLVSIFVSPVEPVPVETKAILLAGSTQKAWYLTSKTPEPAMAPCQSSSPQSMDNTWTFYADGTFTYNHGAVTEDADCNEPGCCSDLANLEGSWELKGAEEGLTITALKLQESQESIGAVTLMDARILLLEEGRLRLSQKHPETGVETVFEFKTR
jgi:hypothetical protein